MSDAVDLWEIPEADEIYMLAGWWQWADAGSISSGLPQYLIKKTQARQIGTIRPDGFYLFQIPGAHHLIRPVVKFEEGYPKSLEGQRNEIYYTTVGRKGLVFFVGDEPQMDVERYTEAFIHVVRTLNVRRVVGFGGVYGELPYDKERWVHGIYSMLHLKDELGSLAVELSDYQGGSSIGTYICRRAGEQDLEYVAFYAFVPTYDFSNITQIGSTIRLENDFMAWLGVMRRVNYMLNLDIDLSGLERRSERLVKLLNDKVEELDNTAPQLGVKEFMAGLSEDFTETTFEPLDDVWEDELRRLFDDGE
jgi:proteasome assembly chaperone (PAC2) family protein